MGEGLGLAALIEVPRKRQGRTSLMSPIGAAIPPGALTALVVCRQID